MAYYSIQCYRTFGNNATTQNLFTITNRVGSRYDIYIRRLICDLDPVATALTSVMPIVKTSRATDISGGVVLNDVQFDTSANAPVAEIRSPLVDGSPITATPGDTIWQQYTIRLHTAVEQVTSWDATILPTLIDTQSFILHPGESLLCQVVGSATTSNPSNNNQWFIQCVWEETALSTFAISGTVTLGGSPISGAIVTVVESDDESMTNAVLVETIVTPAGGTWASSIKTGKVGAAFVQYESGGTYYTALGSPYLE